MSLKVIETGTIRKLWCGFLFVFHSNNRSILHYFPGKARYWSKIVVFLYPLHLATRRRKNIDITALSTEYRRVTDRRTDGEMDGESSCHGIVRAMIRVAR